MTDSDQYSFLPGWNDIQPVYREHWLKVLTEIPLPPASFGDIAATTANPMSFEEWIELITADPVLSGKILAVVNSASRGLIRPLTDIHRAVTHLGLNLTRIVVLAYYVEGLLARWEHYPKQHFTFVRQWSACAAVLAYNLALSSGVADAGTLATAALLSRLGTLVLGLEWPGPSGEYRLLPNERARTDYELATWQINTPILSGALTRQWGLPEPLPTLVEQHMAALYGELDPGADSLQLTIMATATALAADYLRDPESVDVQLHMQPDNQLLLDNIERLGLIANIQATIANPTVIKELSLMTS